MELPAWAQRLADQCTDEEMAHLERILAMPSAASSPRCGAWKGDASNPPACNHVWETWPDGQVRCFECDARRVS